LPRLKDIERNFGPDVAQMVEGLSDSLSEDPCNKQPWLERKHADIQRLREEPADAAGAAVSGRGALYDLAFHQSSAPTMEGA
jgi:hypothetical protein